LLIDLYRRPQGRSLLLIDRNEPTIDRSLLPIDLDR